jgi:hypothetical protein
VAITVTAAQGGVTFNGMALRVMVLTQAARTQSGATASANGVVQVAVTPNQTGSRVYGAGIAPNGSYSVNGATTQIDNLTDATNLAQYLTCKATATSVSGTPETIGWPGSGSGGGVMLEIQQAGTLTEDGSAPAVSTTTGATTTTTASFTPPAGSLLVAMVPSNGGAGVTTMTVSGGSLTWIEKVKANASSAGYVGVWIAQVPAAAAVQAPARPVAQRRRPPARGIAGGVRGKTNLPLAPPPVTSSIRFPPPKHPRGVWRRVIGQAPPPPVPAVPPRQPPQPRRPGPARGVWRRATGTGNLPPGVTAVPRLPPQPRRRPPGRGFWRQVAGSVPPPPVIVFDALPPPPTFPLTPLDVRTELLLGGTWRDISAYVVQGTGPVGITRGHPDESTTTTPSGTGLTLNNRDFRFTATNPTGPYYGQLVRNTQLRTSVPEGASYLRFEPDQFSYASCPDSAAVSITGDMEIQLDITLDNWNQNQILACKWGASGNQRTWILELLENGTLRFNVSGNGTGISTAASTVPVPLPPLRRMCLRVTFQASTGNVSWYTSPPGLSSPTWTQLGATLSFGALTLFDSTATVQVGWGTDTDDGYSGIYGKFHAFQLLSGIAGTVKASPDFTAQAPGTTSFADAQSNTWTLHGTGAISNRKYRLHAETSAWPQSWDPSGTNVTVQLTAAGVLRRMSQGTSKPLNSAMNRAYVRLGGSIAPVAYWPCEDGTQATQLASGLGGPAMQIAGAPSLASDSAFLCSLPIPTLNNSIWTGAVPPYTGGVDNVLRFVMQVPAAGDTNGGIIARMYTTGTIARADLVYGTGGGLSMLIYNAAGTLLNTFGPAAFSLNGALVRVSLELQASGGNVSCNFVTIVAGATSGLDDSNTQTGASVGNVKQIVINPGGLLTGTAIGQISVQPVWDTLFDLAGALEAWVGEPAGVRFKRLCDEEGIGFRGQGSLHDTVAMGPQSATALTTLLQECVDADRGAMVEPRQVLALGYRTRASMLNQAPAVTLPYSMLMFPLGETEDDQIVQNDVTVTQNSDGSFSEQVLTSGALSIQPPPGGVGRYDVSVPVNIAVDSALDDEAGWILHMGTVNEPRYPQIDIDLASAEAGIASQFWSLLDLDLGDRLVITNPPPWLPPGSIDQLVQGVTENLGVKICNMAWAGVPSSPWNVMVWNDPLWGRWDTDSSTLHANISSGATSMLVDTTNAGSPLWTTAAGDFPFDVLLAGERVTVTNITGSISPQTFTITRAVNGVTKAQTAGAAVSLFSPPIWSL